MKKSNNITFGRMYMQMMWFYFQHIWDEIGIMFTWSLCKEKIEGFYVYVYEKYKQTLWNYCVYITMLSNYHMWDYLGLFQTPCLFSPTTCNIVLTS